MQKKLNRFNQDDINQAIESFDESYAQLKYIYTSILEFSSPKTGIEMKKVLQDFINTSAKKVEDSLAYGVLVEIFGISYENSKKTPTFFDIFQGIPISSTAILPWQMSAGQIYKSNVEKEFKNIQGSKALKISNIQDYEKIIQVKPNESKVIFDRMKDGTRSQRCKELFDLYTYICFAQDMKLDLEVVHLKIEGLNIKQCIKSENLTDLRKEVFDMCIEYYKIFEKDLEASVYEEPLDESLNWSTLIAKANEYKNKLIEFREKDVQIFNKFDKSKKEVLCIEVREVLEANNQNIYSMPSSTILNKMIGGSGVVKNIGKKFKYPEFILIYQEWIKKIIETELTVKSRFDINSKQTQAINPFLDNLNDEESV